VIRFYYDLKDARFTCNEKQTISDMQKFIIIKTKHHQHICPLLTAIIKRLQTIWHMSQNDKDVPDIRLYPVPAGYPATFHNPVPVPDSQETG